MRDIADTDRLGGTLDALTFTMAPSDYFKRQFSACFWFEGKNMRNTIDCLGVDSILWESDFPHPTCLYPERGGV